MTISSHIFQAAYTDKNTMHMGHQDQDGKFHQYLYSFFLKMVMVRTCFLSKYFSVKFPLATNGRGTKEKYFFRPPDAFLMDSFYLLGGKEHFITRERKGKGWCVPVSIVGVWRLVGQGMSGCSSLESCRDPS
jgi:hypothetical protein